MSVRVLLYPDGSLRLPKQRLRYDPFLWRWYKLTVPIQIMTPVGSEYAIELMYIFGIRGT
jgi:hypothetical protein